MKLAARAIIIHNNEILLVRHKHREFYALPGGKIDPNEDIKTALVREMIEELSVEIRDPKLIFVHEFRYPNAGDFSVEFFFTVGNPEDFRNWKPGTHTEIELAEIVWKPITEEIDLMPLWLREKLPNLGEEIEYISDLSKKS